MLYHHFKNPLFLSDREYEPNKNLKSLKFQRQHRDFFTINSCEKIVPILIREKSFLTQNQFQRLKDSKNTFHICPL